MYRQKRPLKKFHFSSKIKLPPYHVSTTSENRFLSSKIFRNSHRGVRNILAKFQPWKIKLTSPTVNFLTCQICWFSIWKGKKVQFRDNYRENDHIVKNKKNGQQRSKSDFTVTNLTGLNSIQWRKSLFYARFGSSISKNPWIRFAWAFLTLFRR